MPRGKQFSAQEKAAAIAALDGGENHLVIAKRLGLAGSSALYGWRKQLRKAKGGSAARTPTSRRRISPKLRALALKRMAAGEAPTQVAKELKVSVPAIYKWRSRAQQSTPRVAARSGPVDLAAAGTGTGNLNNLLRDVLIYLRDGEREVMAMMRSGAIKKPDRAHLMLQLALAEVEKALK